jgi:excisionase family DNA binding protein
MAVEIPSAIPVDALAERLGVSAWTVRTWVRQGRLPYIKIGRRVLVRTEDAVRLLEASYRPATRPA